VARMGKTKWYVNLPYDPKKSQGGSVPLRAKPSGSGDEAPWIAKWEVVPEGGSNTESKYLSLAARAQTADKFSLASKDDRFRTRLHLPQVGGDCYKVKCSKPDGSGTQEIGPFETWRKIFVSVHYMDAAALAIFNTLKPKVKAVFEKVFVELVFEPAAPTKTLVAEPWTCATPSNLPHLYSVAATPLTQRPHHLRLALVTELFDKKTETYGPLEVRKANCTAAGIRRYHFGRPLGWAAADSGCSRCRVSLGGALPWREITGLVKKAGADDLEVDLKSDAAAWGALSAGNPVWLYIETRERDEGFNGYCLDNFAALKTNRPEGAAGIAMTFAHEVGHALGQSVLRERKFDADGKRDGWEKNPDWHEDAQGGQGPHCHHDAKLVASTKTTSNKIWAWNGKPLCVMFFCSDPHRKGEYCPKCEKFFRRTNLCAASSSTRTMDLPRSAKEATNGSGKRQPTSSSSSSRVPS
jgi:hypothetical protein